MRVQEMLLKLKAQGHGQYRWVGAGMVVARVWRPRCVCSVLYACGLFYVCHVCGVCREIPDTKEFFAEVKASKMCVVHFYR